MKKSLIFICFSLLSYFSIAQVRFPDTLHLKSLTYKNGPKTTGTFDFSKTEKKAFLFFDIKTEALAEAMYNGCRFVFDRNRINIFPVFFTGELTKKASEDFETIIPMQLYRSPYMSDFKEFNLSDADFPILVVYNEKNELCGFSRNVEQISGIDCGEIGKAKFLRLKILTEEKNKKLKPYANKPIYVIGGNHNDTVAKLVTNAYGDFETQLPNMDQDYLITVNEKIRNINFVVLSTQSGDKIGNFSSTDKGFVYRILQTELTKLPDLNEEEELEMKVRTLKEKSPDEFSITENLYYELGESNLTLTSKELLIKMVTALEKYPQFNLIVVSHTDSQGDETANLKLSLKRSEAVVNYLISKGIKKERLKAEGKGETEIRNRCVNNVDCSDKEHEFNRRTEFKFVKK